MSLEPLPLPAVVAIGNFDGVHQGHQALLGRLLAEAEQAQLLPSVLTFFPHPAVVLGRAEHPVLTRLSYRIELLQRVAPGLQVLVQEFDQKLAALSPEQFVREVLLTRCQARRVLVGENFRFGKHRQGDLQTLRALGETLGFEAAVVPLSSADGAVVSSSRIRALIQAGQVAEAGRLLGREHVLLGDVVAGKQLGRKLGFPTANLAAIEELLPADGVYACRVESTALTAAPAVCNIGVRPTVDGTRRCVEVHLLSFSGDLYGQQLRVSLVARLRAERAFADLGALRAQIAQDVAQATSLLAAGP